MLSDSELFLQMLKIMIAIGIFYKPIQMYRAGYYNALISEFIGVSAVAITNSYLIKCIRYMPK